MLRKEKIVVRVILRTPPAADQKLPPENATIERHPRTPPWNVVESSPVNVIAFAKMMELGIAPEIAREFAPEIAPGIVLAMQFSI